MNKRGDTEGQDFLSANLIYIVLWIVMFTILMIFVTGFTRGEILWESLYAQQIVQVINGAEPGANIALDISPLVELAYKHAKPRNAIVTVDNVANKVTVSVRPNGGTSFYYFNDVDVTDINVQELADTTGNSKISFNIRGRVK